MADNLINWLTGSSKDGPYNNFRYKIEFGGTEIGGFTKISGLTLEANVLEYREGGLNDVVHKFPTHLSPPNVTLHRGMTEHEQLLKWMTKSMTASRQKAQSDVTITMLDKQGESTWGWDLLNAYPVRWEGPELLSNSSGVAIELLELACESVDYVTY